MIGAPTLEELCEISLGADWYQLGLWLGLEDTTLSLIKDYDSFYDLSLSENLLILKKMMFEKYLEKSYKTEQYKRFSMQLSFELTQHVNDFFSKEYSTQVVNLEEIKHKLGDSQRAILDELFQKQQENRRGMKKNVLIALLRAHLMEEAQKFCLSQGEKERFEHALYSTLCFSCRVETG